MLHYGFRLRRDGAFFHPDFRRGNLEACMSLPTVTVKGTWVPGIFGTCFHILLGIGTAIVILQLRACSTFNVVRLCLVPVDRLAYSEGQRRNNANLSPMGNSSAGGGNVADEALHGPCIYCQFSCRDKKVLDSCK